MGNELNMPQAVTNSKHDWKTTAICILIAAIVAFAGGFNIGSKNEARVNTLVHTAFTQPTTTTQPGK